MIFAISVELISKKNFYKGKKLIQSRLKNRNFYKQKRQKYEIIIHLLLNIQFNNRWENKEK